MREYFHSLVRHCPTGGACFFRCFAGPLSRFNPSGTDVGGPAAVRPPGRGRRPGAHGHAMRTSGRRYVPPMVPRPAAQQEAAGHHHPTEPASGCFPATTSKRPCRSLRNTAAASASARLSKGPCSSPVSRSTTVYSGSQAGIPRKWLDLAYDLRAHGGHLDAPWLFAPQSVQIPARRLSM